MSKRSYKIAEAIMDRAVVEYRFVNLRNTEAVDEYAFNALEIVVNEKEAAAILAACRAYIAYLAKFELPNLHGSDNWAIEPWAEIVRKPLEKYNGRNLSQTLDRIKAAFCVLVENPTDHYLNWIFSR